MEISTILSNPINIASLVGVVVLVVERLITGGYLRIMLGKKTFQDTRNTMQDGRDSAAAGVSWDLLKRMDALELHFNHETTANQEALMRGQEKIIDMLVRIERDGIRIRQ